MSTPASDDADLERFGYRGELRRTLGGFSAFCVSFGLISILTGLFTGFGLGFAFSGPTMFWVWCAVFVAQLCVALVFCELAARFPLAGSAYQWASRMGGRGGAWGWAAGWFYLAALFLLQPALASAIQQVLTTISPSFELIGSEVPGIFDADFAKNALILGVAMFSLTTAINVLGVRWLARMANVVVLLELIGVAVLIVVLLTHATRGPAVVNDPLSVADGHSWGLFGALLVGAFFPLFTFFGFDNASSVAEETEEPRRRGPQAILRSYLTSGIVGGLVILLVLMAIPDIRDPDVAALGLNPVVSELSGDTLGRLLLADVALAIVGACTAGQALTARLIYAMARDGQLPCSRVLARVSPRTRVPVVPTLVAGVVPMLVLLVGLVNIKIFQAIISIGLVLVYIAYLCVTVPVLLRRRRGWPGSEDAAQSADGLFSLGRWGMPVNVVAVAWGLVMTVNLGWPRAEFFGPEWYQQYVAVIVVPLVAVAGLVCRRALIARGTSTAAAGGSGAPSRPSPGRRRGGARGPRGSRPRG